jgi:glycerophosphotransferase
MRVFKKIKYIEYIISLPICILTRFIKRDINIWVFGAWSGKKYSDNSRAFFEYCIENHPEVKAYWITKNKDIYSSLKKNNIPVLLFNSKEAKKVCLKAGMFFLTNGVGDVQKFYVGNAVQILLWHGMPLKKIGLDEINFRKKKSIETKIVSMFYRYNKLNPSFVIVNSRFFIPFFMSAFKITESKILQTGSPRCDKLFVTDKKKFVFNLKYRYKNCKVILYMPTFRTISYTGEAFNPFGDFYFNEDKLSDILDKENLFFLYKPHFMDEGVSFSLKSKRCILVNDAIFDDLYSFLHDVDILMTDYSSVYFDFIALNKPVILTPFDYDDYLRFSRPHYFNYYDYMEGVKARNWDEVILILKEKKYFTVSENTRKRFAEFIDGNANENLFYKIKNKYLK